MAYTPAPIEPTLSLRPEPRGDDHTFFGHPRGLGWLSYAEFWSLLLLVGGANFLIAAPAPHGPSSQAQCVALGLSTCPQPFDACLHAELGSAHPRDRLSQHLSSVPRGRNPYAWQ